MQAAFVVLGAGYSSAVLVHIGRNIGHNTLPMLQHSAPEFCLDLH